MKWTGLYQNISVSITMATVLSVLAKIAVLHHEDGQSWFINGNNADALFIILIGVFMIFFRGKMMHDDDAFFVAVDRGEFQSTPQAKRILKIGLILGYIAWLCWAPAIYFMEKPQVLSLWMLLAMSASTGWLITDIITRKPRKGGTHEAEKRWWWVALNVAYAAPFICMLIDVEKAPHMSVVLVILLILDWIFLDSLLTTDAMDT